MCADATPDARARLTVVDRVELGWKTLRWRRVVALVVAIALAVGCAGDTDPGEIEEPPVVPAEPGDPTVPDEAVVPEAEGGTAAAPVEPADPGCPAVPSMAEPDPDRPRYEASLTIDPDAGTFNGEVDISFVPDEAIDRVVLRLWPNSPVLAEAGVRVETSGVTLDGEPVDIEQPDPTTLVVGPGTEHEAGTELRVAASIEGTVDVATDERVSRDDGSLRLGSVLPLLAWEPGVGWATEPPTEGFSEAVSSPAADWEVQVEVPEGFDVLATGEEQEEGVWRIVSARDFALTVGRFETVSRTVEVPGEVEVVVGVHEGVGEDPQVYLDSVSEAMTWMAEHYGAYPWGTFSLAIVPALGGGIEFPAHVMQGPGTLDGVTPHEVAHMWFYGLVGNNQGREPWLDEGLTSWAEFRIDGVADELDDVELPRRAEGFAGEPMTFWDQRSELYYLGVYLQPAVALAGLAPPEVIDCALAHYVAENAHQIATGEDVVAALELVVDDAREQLEPYGLP
jgi:hypothetical protein